MVENIAGCLMLRVTTKFSVLQLIQTDEREEQIKTSSHNVFKV